MQKAAKNCFCPDDGGSSSFEILVPTYLSILCGNQEDNNLNIYNLENLKFYVSY
jgi:hypothetical protein